ncbi:MAG TPA: DEAD/DEAH box helicase, partial [Actinocrinis sp.]|nr:DEAD/DEAH box helicase [Actinocrinis sp.]
MPHHHPRRPTRRSTTPERTHPTRHHSRTGRRHLTTPTAGQDHSADALAPYARSVALRTATVVGGMPVSRQAQALRRGADVVIATPGRLKDLIDRGHCHLDEVAITVLDEADQMADMGFMPQVTALLDQVAPDGQRMLFSA